MRSKCYQIGLIHQQSYQLQAQTLDNLNIIQSYKNTRIIQHIICQKIYIPISYILIKLFDLLLLEIKTVILYNNKLNKQIFSMELDYYIVGNKSPILLLPKIKSKTPQESYKKNKQQQTTSNVYRLRSNDILKGQLKNKSQQKHKITLRTQFLKSSKQLVQRKLGKYQIVKEVGKGGFAKVFECKDNQNARYALKQYQLQNANQCYINEYIIGQKINSNHLIKYIDRMRIGKKGYIIQQMGGNNLSKMLSDIQGTFYQSERVYEILFKNFYKELTHNLTNIILQLCEGIRVLNRLGYTHCDLKTQNILVDNDGNVKIIDFGSAFQYLKPIPKITITPEYMSPQLLNYLIDHRTQNRWDKIDIWSLGCILLEIVTGLPLWFKYKCKIDIKGKVSLQLGYFALTNRDYSKIIKKQKEIIKDLNKIPFVFNQFQKFREILKYTLQFDPNKRISIDQLIQQLQKL